MWGIVMCSAVVLASCGAFYSGDNCSRLQGSTCKPLRQCPRYLETIHSQQRLTKYLLRELRALHCGYDGRVPLICCKSSEESNGKIAPHFGTSADLDPENVPGRITYPRAEHKNLQLLPTHCEEYYNDRITGGKAAQLNEFPWMVQLLYSVQGDTKLSHQCGGTLINERYVLTAAHCIVFNRRRSLQEVALGEHDVRKNPDCHPSEPNKCYYIKKIKVHEKDVVVHKNYSKNDIKRRNDIALIRLPVLVDTSLDNMKPICLPTTVNLQNRELEDVFAIVAGWGVTSSGLGAPALASVLQHAALPIISRNQCTEGLYKNTEIIENSQLCTGAFRKRGYGAKEDGDLADVCPGDSGGPLASPVSVDGSVSLVQWGIISFGARQCATGVPSVYTRVASYMDWILDNIRE